MTNICVLKNSLLKTIEVISKKTISTSNCKIISNWNYDYNYGGIDIFETTFVDTLIHSLLMNDEVKTIGWEINYPFNSDGKPWYKSKLDLALGILKERYEPCNYNWEDQSLFSTAIEVKKLRYLKDMDITSEIIIWQDIFKLFGYYSPYSSEIGKEKIMLIFSTVNNEITEIEYFKKEIIKKYKDMDSLKNSEKLIEATLPKGKRNILIDKNDYNLNFILEKLLKWENEEDRKFLIDICKLSIDKPIIKKVDFVYDQKIILKNDTFLMCITQDII